MFVQTSFHFKQNEVLQFIDVHKNTKEWLEAEAKWNQLVQTYSIDEDENWFKRREGVRENNDEEL